MQIVSTIGLITINETMVVQLVSFLVFVFVINRVMFRPLQQAMKQRSEHLGDLETQIRDSEKELEALRHRLDQEEHRIRREAHHQRESLEDAGQARAEQILEEARTHIHDIREASVQAVEAELAEARRSIRPEAEALCVLIMEKLLDRRVPSHEQA